MRLIDANELKQQFVDKLVIRVGLSPKKAQEFAKTAFDATFKIIDNTPTIEAVPVSWIRSQVDFGKWQELVQRWREENGKVD